VALNLHTRTATIGFASLLLVGFAVSGCDPKASDTTTAQDGTGATTAPKAKPKTATDDGAPSSKFPMQDGDWRLDSLTVTNQDFTHSFTGRARVTYTGDDKGGGDNIFTITVFKGTKDVGTLTGSANTVLPGKAKTVELISSDDYVSGANKYTFQNDL
jgi:hypothetical protein